MISYPRVRSAMSRRGVAAATARGVKTGAGIGWRHRLGEWSETAGSRPGVSAVTVLAVLYAVGAFAIVVAIVFPLSSAAPTGLELVVGLIDLAAAAALALARQRIHGPLLHLCVMLRVMLATVLVSRAASAAGVALIGFAFVCVALYAAYFLPRPAARFHTGLALLGFAAGTSISRVHSAILVQLIVGAFVVAAEELLGALINRLRTQAGTDVLTGLANRMSFRAAASREMTDIGRRLRPFSLVLIDLDGFKAINDAGGHLAGDTLLIELTRAWASRLRRTDLLARYGGDEFALLLRNTTPAQSAPLLDQLRAAHPMSWSAGVTGWMPDTDLDAMFEQADRDLYRAKRRRRLAPGYLATLQRPRRPA